MDNTTQKKSEIFWIQENSTRGSELKTLGLEITEDLTKMKIRSEISPPLPWLFNMMRFDDIFSSEKEFYWNLKYPE